MARPLRLECAGALWHVVNRGVDRRAIYLDDADRRIFLTLLETAIQTCGWRMHAYVLMPNHYHLLFETPQTNLSRGMQELNAEFARRFNKRHRRSGHLFGGRFKNHLIDSENYLLNAARYIVLNPVRAGLTACAADWRWSSYQATGGSAPVPSWLDADTILRRFDPVDRVNAQREYREFIAAAEPGSRLGSATGP